jgi:hypothetical protein
MLVSVVCSLSSSCGGRRSDGLTGPPSSTTRWLDALALALRRAQFLVRLVATPSPPPAQAATDAAEHQRLWREHTMAAERFHAIVLGSRAQPEDRPGGAQQPD